MDPLAIDHKLGDGALASVLDDFVDGTGGGLDIDIFVGDVVLGEEALGFAAFGTPEGGVDGQFHGLDKFNHRGHEERRPPGLDAL